MRVLTVWVAPAHPRSRGEHPGTVGVFSRMCGSSPLARGTYLVDGLQNVGRRLIPARAGNICWRSHDGISRTAHPRSRGEHGFHHCHAKGAGGSSPLARGTSCAVCQKQFSRLAHPRSRGEHCHNRRIGCLSCGSSPLARGTLSGRRVPAVLIRLIPARAGNIA